MIDSVSSSSVDGTLISNANTSENTIEVFKSPSCDDSGYAEGETFLGSIDMNVGDGGSGTWSVSTDQVANGDAVTATVTAGQAATPPSSRSASSQTSVRAAAPRPTAPARSPGRRYFAPGSTGNTVVFTYTAADGGMVDGGLTLTVPEGWSEPSTSGGDDGYTITDTGDLNVDGRTIYINGITLAGGASMTITYGDTGSDGHGATAPDADGTQDWPAQQRSSTDRTLTDIAPPTTVVGTPLSDLNVSVTPTSIGAGITSVKLADIPPAWVASLSARRPTPLRTARR